MTKTAFVAIVGKPNVGKSSLLNKILGQKIAIVSSKPQTTRTKIMGVLTKGETQLVFTDTPGFHKPHNKLGEKMNEAVGDTVGGVDACLFLTEPRGELNEQELQLLDMFKKQKMPVILAINKIDMINDKEELLKRIVYLTSFYDFTAVVPVSATQGDHVDELIDELVKIAKNLKGKEEVVSKFKNFLNPEQQQKLDSIMNKISEAEIQDKINSKKSKKSSSHHSPSGKKTVKKVKRVKKSN